jgi:trimeric autotransporter adhesin
MGLLRSRNRRKCLCICKVSEYDISRGAYNIAGGIVSKGIAAWDGSTWQHFADATSVSGYGCVFSLLVDGNNLYISGCFNSINGIQAQGVAHYDGFQWHSYPMLDPVNIAFVDDIEIFNGELYVAGDFNVGPGLKDIVKFDGTNWVTVGGGLSGGNTFVDNMMVYQGELYIVGEFNISTGDPGNSIAKWNGAAWSSLGSGLNAGGQLFGIAAFKNEIYAGGLFSSIGGITTSFIARWDGSNWGSIGTFDNGVDWFASTANDLYMGGGFKTINGDTMNYITRYSPPLEVQENTWNASGIIISPNPGTGNFSLNSLFYPIESIRLFDLSGRVVFLKDKILNNSYEYKLNLRDGIYVAEVFIHGNAYRSKMVIVR